MIGEQTVTCRYKTAGQAADIEIQMTVQLERRAELYGDVSIEHHYDSTIFPEELWDECFQRLNNGVHGGYALSNVPYIPDTILSVRILELSISPSPQRIQDAHDKVNLGYLLEVTICGIVQTILCGLENLHSGQESYYEWLEPRSDEGSEDDTSI